jgi:hypothetical protein
LVANPHCSLWSSFLDNIIYIANHHHHHHHHHHHLYDSSLALDVPTSRTILWPTWSVVETSCVQMAANLDHILMVERGSGRPAVHVSAPTAATNNATTNNATTKPSSNMRNNSKALIASEIVSYVLPYSTAPLRSNLAQSSANHHTTNRSNDDGEALDYSMFVLGLPEPTPEVMSHQTR